MISGRSTTGREALVEASDRPWLQAAKRCLNTCSATGDLPWGLIHDFFGGRMQWGKFIALVPLL